MLLFPKLELEKVVISETTFEILTWFKPEFFTPSMYLTTNDPVKSDSVRIRPIIGKRKLESRGY